VNEAKENILATFAYFDISPSTSGEIYLFLKNKYHQTDFSVLVAVTLLGVSQYQLLNCQLLPLLFVLNIVIS